MWNDSHAMAILNVSSYELLKARNEIRNSIMYNKYYVIQIYLNVTASVV
jgi:hypothetical protein